MCKGKICPKRCLATRNRSDSNRSSLNRIGSRNVYTNTLGVTSTVSFSETGGSLAKPSEGLLKSQNALSRTLGGGLLRSAKPS